MRDEFRGYYPPTDAETETLWETGLIVLDTNALLNLFRYSENAREDFFKALKLKEESLWIPHQVGLEFHRRRIDVIDAQANAFDEIEGSLTKAKNAVENALSGYKRHPSLDTTLMVESLTKSIDDLNNQLSSARETHKSDFVEGKTNEETLDTITTLYRGRVGPAFTQERLKAIYMDGASRYENAIPPGYKDKDKAEPARYGDLVLWEQILEHAGGVKKPAIFITDDQKEDWWYIVNSKRYGPRPELVDEYYSAAEARVHFMTPNRFLDFAKARTTGIRSESVSEVEEVSSARLHQFRSNWTERDLERSDENLKRLLRRYPVADPFALRADRLMDDPRFRAVSNDVRALQAQMKRTRAEIERLEATAGELGSRASERSLQHIRRRQDQLRDDLRMAQQVLEAIIARAADPSSTIEPIGDLFDEYLESLQRRRLNIDSAEPDDEN